MKKKSFFASKENRPRIQPQSFTRMLPNLATVMATCSGLSSIRFALMGNFHLAATAILIAAVLDAMDGRLARLLGASSDFGAELDSLSDFVSFGVAPAVVIYVLCLHTWHGFGWCICLFFAVCVSLRLARFNVMSREPERPSWSKHFFTGVPAPAGAMIALFPLLLNLASEIELFKSPLFCAFFLAGSGFLMVSRFPTYSFKSVRIPNRLVPIVLIIVGLVVASAFNAPWETVTFSILAYMMTIPFAIFTFRKMILRDGSEKKPGTSEDQPIVETDHEKKPESGKKISGENRK